MAAFTFSSLDSQVDCFANRDGKEQLLQWNLDTNLKVFKFRFAGAFNISSSADHDALIKDLFYSDQVINTIQCSGSAIVPFSCASEMLTTDILTLDFFDCLHESVINPSGLIKGCMDETFEGLTVGDKLREMLVNESSDNYELFTATQKNELIFKIFKLFAIGGSMCQPESNVARYLEMTKKFYKEIVTVYREEITNNIRVASKVLQIKAVEGLELFPGGESAHNVLIVVVDPLKKIVTIIKNQFVPFW